MLPGENRSLLKEDAPTEDAETEKKKKEKVEVSSSSGGDTVGWATIGPSWLSDMTLEGQIKFYRNEKRRMIEKHADTWSVERKWIERSWKERIREFMGETHFAFETLVSLADMEEAKEDEVRRQQEKSVLTYQFGGAVEKEDTEDEGETEIEETASASGYSETMQLSDPPDQESRGIRVLTRGGQKEGR